MPTRVVHVNKSNPPFVQFSPNFVYIGRTYNGFKDEGWGNPFHIGSDGNRKVVLEKYRAWLLTQRHLLERIVRGDLSGKILGCWCYPLSCHGDALARLANMRVGFEPGDGSFHITLEVNELFPREWNIPGATIYREYEPNKYRCLKQLNEVVPQ